MMGKTSFAKIEFASVPFFGEAAELAQMGFVAQNNREDLEGVAFVCGEERRREEKALLTERQINGGLLMAAEVMGGEEGATSLAEIERALGAVRIGSVGAREEGGLSVCVE